MARGLLVVSSKSAPKVELPATWEHDLEVACSPHHALVYPLVADLLAERPERSLLRPDFVRLSEPPPAAVTWAGFALAREAYGPAGAEPGWVKATADELRTLQEETRRLRTSARGHLVELVLEAEAALRPLMCRRPGREWLTTARDEVGKATQDASVERRRAAVR